MPLCMMCLRYYCPKRYLRRRAATDLTRRASRPTLRLTAEQRSLAEIGRRPSQFTFWKQLTDMRVLP